MSQSFSFNDLQLSAPLLSALESLNFTTPSPIQEQTIPVMMEGRDVIGQAQTGTGKTAAFALPILNAIDAAIKKPQALIIAPTRELAIQVAEQVTLFAKHMKGVVVTVLCGGQNYRPQLQQLRDGAHIVVGTPGRILDHIDRKSLVLDALKTFVLDEADEMLRMGFIDDVESILSNLPEKKQIALFSATMPGRIRKIATQYLESPISVEIKSETATVKSIEQKFLFVNQGQKTQALVRILSSEAHQGVIVFVRTKSSCDEIATEVQSYGFRAMAIHGDLVQSVRERIIGQFKQGSLDILVATDVAARGLDVDRVSHVINYDVSQDCETYVHRIGRTGRAGRCGVSILFVTPKEGRLLNAIERHTRQKMQKIAVPTNEQIDSARRNQLNNEIVSRLQHPNLSAYQSLIEKVIEENNLSGTDVASALALMLHQDKPWKNDLPTVSAASGSSSPFSERSEKRGRKGQDDSRFSSRARRDVNVSTKFSKERTRKSSHDQATFRIDVGRIHGVKPGNIVGAIANEAGIQGHHITGLKIHDDYSTVCLPKDISREIVMGLQQAWVCGRQLKLKAIAS